jgi:hypothetical protein
MSLRNDRSEYEREQPENRRSDDESNQDTPEIVLTGRIFPISALLFLRHASTRCFR